MDYTLEGMAQQTPAAKECAVIACSVDKPDLTQEEIGTACGVSEATVSRLLRRYEPVSSALRSVRRDLFTSLYQAAAIESVDAMYAMKSAGKLTAADRRNYAVSSAVFAEKALLFAGQPTQIVAGMHEVRVELPALMARLAEVGTRMRALTGTTGGGEAGNDASGNG